MVNKNVVAINQIEDFDKIRDKWIVSEKGNDMTVFQSYEWNKLLYSEWGNYKYNRIFSKIEIFIAEKDGDWMIVPVLVQEHSSALKVGIGRKAGIYLLGYGSYSDYLNAIYNKFSDELFTELLQMISKRHPSLNVYFTNIREDTGTYRYLSKKNKIENTTISVYVDIPESGEEFNKTLSKHTRQNLRTALNRMNKDNMEYEWYVKGTIDDTKTRNILSTMHMNRMRTKNYDKSNLKHRVTSWIRLQLILYSEKHNNIVLKSMATMENSFTLMIKLNGMIVGYIYGLKECNGTIRIMQNCIDEKYFFYSPMFRGIYDFIMENCCDNKINKLDFTRGDEEYKYKLGGKEIRLYDFII